MPVANMLEQFGVSLEVVGVFFLPLLAGVVVCVVLALRRRMRAAVEVARILSAIWIVASCIAGFLIKMGYFFAPARTVWPIITVPLWLILGLGCIWLPIRIVKALL
jgi:hypothetical protein